MFEVIASEIPGVVELRPAIRADRRGGLVKTVHAEFFARHGLGFAFQEQYYSTSAARVIRGLHFQRPPHDHYKLVTCLFGHAFDVVLDLRPASPTFGRHVATHLSSEIANEVYIPAGCAHGFYSYTDKTTLLYNVSSIYSPFHDDGIRWDSAGISWPAGEKILSERDVSLPPLAKFINPF